MHNNLRQTAELTTFLDVFLFAVVAAAVAGAEMAAVKFVRLLLCVGTISMPLYTVYILSQKTWPFGEVLCDLWLSLDYTACLCSIYTVFCITVDRFCSIRMPARYRVWRTERKMSKLMSSHTLCLVSVPLISCAKSST